MARVVLKMSGEAITDVENGGIISAERLDGFSRQVVAAMDAEPSLQVALVVGGGNIIRGKSLQGIPRITGDYMGMLATVINALPLKDSLTKAGRDSRILSGIDIPRVAEPYIQGRALRHLEKGRILIFAGGMGNPFFTSDTAAALRASEIGASMLLYAKFGTDGVYDKDPRRFADAVKFKRMTYDEFLAQNLQVMDSEAVSLCRNNGLPIYVFDTEGENAVRETLLGETGVGTYIGDTASPSAGVGTRSAEPNSALGIPMRPLP